MMSFNCGHLFDGGKGVSISCQCPDCQENQEDKFCLWIPKK